MKKNTKIIVWSIVGLAVATGAFFGIRSLVKKAKARKAIRDTPQPEPDVNAPTSDQVKKAWLEQQAKNITSITDKSRFEPFTKIPNYMEGIMSLRVSKTMVYKPNDEIIKYLPNGDFLMWYSDNNLVAFRDNKKEDLKMYLENGNIVSKTPQTPDIQVWKYLGTWK